MRADTRARRVCPLEAAPHRLPSLLTNGSSISDAALGFEVRLVRPGTPSHSGKQKGRGGGPNKAETKTRKYDKAELALGLQGMAGAEGRRQCVVCQYEQTKMPHPERKESNPVSHEHF